MEYRDERNEKYEMDLQAGPVYCSRPIASGEVRRLSRKRDVPQVIQVLVWPYRESTDQSVVLRRYYALNLPQAVARATEIEVRLREQEIQAVLVGIRPATVKETNTFFRALDALEAAAASGTDSRTGRPILCGHTGSEPKTISRQKPVG